MLSTDYVADIFLYVELTMIFGQVAVGDLGQDSAVE